MDSLDFYTMQRVELEELERRLAQARLAHELREERRKAPRARSQRAGNARRWFTSLRSPRVARSTRRPARLA